MDYSIGFIGAGSMGGAIIRSVCRGTDPAGVLVADLDRDKVQTLADQTGCAQAQSAAQVAGSCDIVMLCVKPQALAQTIRDIKPHLHASLIVSIAAGVPLEALRDMLGDGPMARLMPNTPAAVGKGTMLTVYSSQVSGEYRNRLGALLAPCGSVEEVTQPELDLATAISSCGPAFVYQFIEALADGGVEIGLSREKAQRYAAQMTAGAAAMVLESGKHPGALKDEVCSPGGSTIAGVAQLERQAFRSAAAQAVVAACEKNRKLFPR